MYRRLFKYEMEQLIRGIFTPFFGIVFPVLMLVFLSQGASSNTTGIERDILLVSMFTTLMQIIPLAVGFMGFSAVYAQELEQRIPFRLRMFGIKEKAILIAKILALLVFFTIGYLVYVLVAFFYVEIPHMTVMNVLILYGFLVLEMVGLIILGYSISLYFKKFGPAYTMVMLMYFAIMLGSGMMGLRENAMPDIMQKIIRLFPFSYISFDLYKIFFDQSYNFMPLIQSMIFFIGLVIVVCMIVIRFKGAKNEY